MVHDENRVCNASIMLPQKTSPAELLGGRLRRRAYSYCNRPRQWIFSVCQWAFRLAKSLLMSNVWLYQVTSVSSCIILQLSRFERVSPINCSSLLRRRACMSLGRMHLGLYSLRQFSLRHCDNSNPAWIDRRSSNLIEIITYRRYSYDYMSNTVRKRDFTNRYIPTRME